METVAAVVLPIVAALLIVGITRVATANARQISEERAATALRASGPSRPADAQESVRADPDAAAGPADRESARDRR